MAQRRLLVIGSQCDRLNRLDFLPEVAERLHALLIHPGPGECVGVPLDGRTPGLLLDPTVAEAKAAIKLAIEDAARRGRDLHSRVYRPRRVPRREERGLLPHADQRDRADVG